MTDRDAIDLMVGDRVSLPHVGALDGLRGAAVAGVVLYHGDHLTGGYLGVDLFFVLSGYLITSLLLAEWRSRGRISLSQFWARRARRLLPALALVLAGIAVYAVVFADPTELARIRGDALATIGYVANWRSITAHQSYFDLFSAPSPLQHTWSLAIEEQFYVLWPLLFVGIATWWKRHAPHAILVTALTLGAASTLLTQALYDPTNPNRVYFGTDTRAFALFAGIAIAAAVAIWGHPTHRHSRALLELAALISLALLTLMWTTLDGQAPRLYRGGLTLAGIAAALLIASAANPHRGPIAWALSFPPLRWLGLISYGLYLWHWPIDVVLTPTRTGITGWPLFTLRTTLALLIATASYHLIEMPIRRGALRPTQWRIAIPALTTLLIAALITTTAGATQAAGPGGAAVTAATTTELQAQALALNQAFDQEVPRVLLAGDSIALSLGGGATEPHEPPVAIANIGIVGCGIASGTPDVASASPERVCRDWAGIWDRAIRVFRPIAIVLVASAWDIWPRIASGRRVPMYSEQLASDLRTNLDRAASIASSAGVPLVLATLPCLAPSARTRTAIGPGLAEPARRDWINRIYRETARERPDVFLADLEQRTCGQRNLTEDGVHFTPDGAQRIWGWLTPKIEAAAAATDS